MSGKNNFTVRKYERKKSGIMNRIPGHLGILYHNSKVLTRCIWYMGKYSSLCKDEYSYYSTPLLLYVVSLQDDHGSSQFPVVCSSQQYLFTYPLTITPSSRFGIHLHKLGRLLDVSIWPSSIQCFAECYILLACFLHYFPPEISRESRCL